MLFVVFWSCERSLRMLHFQLLYPRLPPPGFHKLRALGSLQFFLKNSLWNVRCSDGKMTCCTRETEILSTLHLIQYWNISFKQLYWSLTSFSSRFPHKFCNSPALILTETLIWNEKDRVKYGDFPDQSQSFCILDHSSHRCKLHKAPKQTMSSLDWSGPKLSHEPFIWVVRVLCKPYSYMVPFAFYVSCALFSLV